MPVKQVYIPKLTVSGTFVEAVGTDADKICYPGSSFTAEISLEDFETPEDYHTVWIALTKAVQRKLTAITK